MPAGLPACPSSSLPPPRPTCRSGEVSVGDELIGTSGRAFTKEQTYQGNVVRGGELSWRARWHAATYQGSVVRGGELSCWPGGMPQTYQGSVLRGGELSWRARWQEIGRASCRERVYVLV